MTFFNHFFLCAYDKVNNARVTGEVTFFVWAEKCRFIGLYSIHIILDSWHGISVALNPIYIF